MTSLVRVVRVWRWLIVREKNCITETDGFFSSEEDAKQRLCDIIGARPLAPIPSSEKVQLERYEERYGEG